MNVVRKSSGVNFLTLVLAERPREPLSSTVFETNYFSYYSGRKLVLDVLSRPLWGAALREDLVSLRFAFNNPLRGKAIL